VAHEWRGNLRELSHTVRALTLSCEGPVVLPEEFENAGVISGAGMT
jgi:DNA-binding NtrC family response regulator